VVKGNKNWLLVFEIAPAGFLGPSVHRKNCSLSEGRRKFGYSDLGERKVYEAGKS
jgi:hypothetical protein